MRGKQFVLAALFCGLTATAARAQSDADGVEVPVDTAVHALDVVSSRMAAYLNAMPTFDVETVTNWTLDGENRRVGGFQCRLRVRHPQSFHLRVGSDADNQASLECASDGETLTRFYRSGSLAIYSRHEGGLNQLLEDAMTDSSVKGSGLDLLTRPDLHRYLMASISKLKDCGEEEIEGRPTHHFSATWFDDSRVDLWIAADREPVLLRWKRTRNVNLGDGAPHVVEIDSRLSWKPDAEFAPDQAAIRISPDAVEVKDLQTYLMKGGTDQLLGQLQPELPLKLLDGTSWDLNRHRDKQFVVLFFFASWALPSTQDMPAVLSFIDEYERRGVAFYAVNVGEAADAVRAFMVANKYSVPVVLDPDQAAARAYRVTSLPVTVLIGKDGRLQAVHIGASPEERALIREDMTHLLEGKQLVPEKAEE